jgi:predicted dehydrogenase
MADRIGVGIVGASPERGWASRAHIPALASLPEFELRAVSTTRMATAAAAATQFGAKLAFDNAEALATDPSVDLVVICVKVPHHLELVIAAVNAGKAVYCEWPLANGLDEAIEMASLARKKGVKTAVGLQARCSPQINFIRDLVADGYVGKVRSTSVIASGSTLADRIDEYKTYMVDKRNGANVFTIPFGHFTDAFCYCLGEFEKLTGTLSTVRKSTAVIETGKILSITAPDQVAVSGVLAGGAVASIHFKAENSPKTNLLWEINGFDGDLIVTGSSGHVQMNDIEIFGARKGDSQLKPLAVPSKYRTAPPETPAGPAINVAQLYQHLASDMKTGTSFAPNFALGVTRHRMLARIESVAIQ